MTEFMVFIVAIAAVAFLLVRGLASMSINSSVSLGTLAGRQAVTASGESEVTTNPTVLAAQSGTLTTRTNGTSGTLTMGASHGLVTGQRVDLYWSGGKCYGAILGTVSGTSVPIASVEGGDALPVATTTIVAGIANDAVMNIVGANLQALLCVAGTATEGYVCFHNGTATVFAAYITPSACYSWYYGSSVTNPLAGATITKAYFSHSTTTAQITDMGAASIVA